MLSSGFEKSGLAEKEESPSFDIMGVGVGVEEEGSYAECFGKKKGLTVLLRLGLAHVRQWRDLWVREMHYWCARSQM